MEQGEMLARWALILGVALLTGCNRPEPSESAAVQPESFGEMRLNVSPAVLADSTTPPQIIKPLTPATDRINNELKRQFAAWDAYAKQCVAGDPDFVADIKVRVPMASEGLLAVVLDEFVFCSGAAHPFSVSAPLFYDARSGQPYDFSKAFSARTLAAKDVTVNPDIKVKGYVASFLEGYYLEHWLKENPDPSRADDCLIYSDRINYLLIWPSAERGGLILSPADQLQSACVEEIVVPIGTLKEWGLDPVLLKAIEGTRPS